MTLFHIFEKSTIYLISKKHNVKGFLLFSSVLILGSCTTIRQFTTSQDKGLEANKLTFIADEEVPHGMLVNETVVGGLSGITYDVKNKLFYVISDDRAAHGPVRYYQVAINHWDKSPKATFKKAVPLLANTGKAFSSKAEYEALLQKGKRPKYTTPDPEDIVYLPKEKNIVWVSEGEKDSIGNVPIVLQPAIYLTGMDGRTITTYQLPKPLKFEAQSGPKRNKAIESLTLSPSGDKMFLATEEPLMEESADPATYDTGFVRLYQYRNATRTAETFYAYPLDIPNDPAIAAYAKSKFGITAMAALNDSTLLVLERTYIPKVGNLVRLYKVSLEEKNKVSSRRGLKERKHFTPLSKKLVLDFNELDGVYIDNIEGMTLGPKVKGKQTLIFVSDNNFNEQQKTMFYYFWLQ